MSTTREQKIAAGTLQKCRDKTRGLQPTGEPILEIQPPDNLSDALKLIWQMTIPPICATKQIRQQDIHELYMAFDWLQEVERIKMERKKLETKQLVSAHLNEWLLLGKRQSKLQNDFVNLMRGYFVSPKERLKAIALIAESESNLAQAAKLDPIDAFLALPEEQNGQENN